MHSCIFCRPKPHYLLAHCRYTDDPTFHSHFLTFFSLQYSTISIKEATPEALANAKLYYNNVEFAFNLCREFAAAERGNPELSVPLDHACKLLERIVDHNAHLKTSHCQPAWPRHTALLHFDLPLQRLTRLFFLTKKWKHNYCVVRGTYLYCHPTHTTGCFGSHAAVHPVQVSNEITLAHMLSNSLPAGHYCVELRGMIALILHFFLCLLDDATQVAV
jgi:hypothetical protein